MKSVLCYGDSNTWGAAPVPNWNEVSRHGPSVRWTGVLKRELGSSWDVVAEGLPARTTVLEDPVDGAHFSGLNYLLPCLLSHRPLDYVVLMLGTNDLKRRFNLSAEEVGNGVDRLLKTVRHSECLAGGMERVLVISPPPLKSIGVFATMFEGAAPKSEALGRFIGLAAAANGAHFLDAGKHIVSSAVDGIHFDASEHERLGRAVAEFLTRIASETVGAEHDGLGDHGLMRHSGANPPGA